LEQLGISLMAMLDRIKVLVDQYSGQVVWLSYRFDDNTPMHDPTLNVYHYAGAPEINAWALYSQYRLFYKPDLLTLYASPLSEFSEDIQLRRAKCIAINQVNNSIVYQYEKFQLGNEKFYANINYHNWPAIFSHAHNCSIEDAAKLVKFKKDEIECGMHTLESFRYLFVNNIKNANTLAEVDRLFGNACIELLSTNNIIISELKTVSAENLVTSVSKKKKNA